jgi:hypothetical protein
MDFTQNGFTTGTINGVCPCGEPFERTLPLGAVVPPGSRLLDLCGNHLTLWRAQSDQRNAKALGIRLRWGQACINGHALAYLPDGPCIRCGATAEQRNQDRMEWEAWRSEHYARLEVIL